AIADVSIARESASVMRSGGTGSATRLKRRARALACTFNMQEVSDCCGLFRGTSRERRETIRAALRRADWEGLGSFASDLARRRARDRGESRNRIIAFLFRRAQLGAQCDQFLLRFRKLDRETRVFFRDFHGL